MTVGRYPRPGQAKEFVAGHVLRFGFWVAFEGRALALVLLRGAHLLHQVSAHVHKGNRSADRISRGWNTTALLGGFRGDDVVEA